MDFLIGLTVTGSQMSTCVHSKYK